MKTEEHHFTSNKERSVYTLVVGLTFCVAFMSNSGGSAISAIFVGLLQILFVMVYLATYRNLPIVSLRRDSKFMYAIFIGFILVTLISTLLAWLRYQDHELFGKAALFREFLTLLRILFILCLASLLLRLSQFYTLFLVIPVSTFLIAIIYLYSLTFGPGGDSNLWVNFPLFGDWPRHIGFLVVTGIVIAVYQLLLSFTKSRLSIFFWSIVLFGNMALLIWLGGRGSLIALGITSVILLFFLAHSKKLKLNYIVIVTFIMISASFLGERLSIFPWNGLSRMVHTLEVKDPPVSSSKGSSSIEKRKQLEQKVDKLASNRVEMWKASIQFANQSPLVGMGPNAFLFMADERFKAIEPHSMLVQWYMEWGISGFVLILLMLANISWMIVKNIPMALAADEHEFVFAALVFSVLTIHGFTDGPYYYGQTLFYLGIAFASILAYLGKKQLNCKNS